jgi:20S proteasome alpha/beta subunit
MSMLVHVAHFGFQGFFFFGFILSGLMNEVKIMLHLSRYHTDPSGTFWQCNAKAIGSGSEGADTALQEHYELVHTPFQTYPYFPGVISEMSLKF